MKRKITYLIWIIIGRDRRLVDCTKANKLLFAYLNIQNLHDLFRANEIPEEYYIEQLNKQFKIKKTLSE